VLFSEPVFLFPFIFFFVEPRVGEGDWEEGGVEVEVEDKVKDWDNENLGTLIENKFVLSETRVFFPLIFFFVFEDEEEEWEE